MTKDSNTHLPSINEQLDNFKMPVGMLFYVDKEKFALKHIAVDKNEKDHLETIKKYVKYGLDEEIYIGEVTGKDFVIAVYGGGMK